MAKPPGGKTVRTRRRARPCKEGASWSMQQGGGLVHAKPRPLTCADFDYIFTIPTSANILPCLWSCYHPLFLRLCIMCNCTCECAITRAATGDCPILHAYAHSSYMFPCTYIPPCCMHTPMYMTEALMRKA